MDIESGTYDLAELAERADVSARTVRYYIQQGLLPAPEARGPGAHYGAGHLDRLRLIRRMQREHLPLAEIRRRLEGLPAREIRELVARAEERPRSSAGDYIRGVLSEPGAKLRARERPPLVMDAEPAPGAMAVQDSLFAEKEMKRAVRARSQWDRITLAPDVELHVRRPLSREGNRQVERLMEAARVIFEEDAT